MQYEEFIDKINNEEKRIFAVYRSIHDKNLPVFLRRLGYEIAIYGFVTPGQFFEGLSNEEFHELKNHANKLFTNEQGYNCCLSEDQHSMYILVLLSHMLCVGEGEAEIILDHDTVDQNVKIVLWQIRVESMHRNKIGHAIRKNYSMFDIDRVIYVPPED